MILAPLLKPTLSLPPCKAQRALFKASSPYQSFPYQSYSPKAVHTQDCPSPTAQSGGIWTFGSYSESSKEMGSGAEHPCRCLFVKMAMVIWGGGWT